MIPTKDMSLNVIILWGGRSSQPEASILGIFLFFVVVILLLCLSFFVCVVCFSGQIIVRGAPGGSRMVVSSAPLKSSN